MKHKTMPASYAPTDGASFQAIVSVFNNVDLGGDVVRPGAFTESIEAWKSSGDPIPVLWSHRFDDPQYNIGAVTEIEEIPGGHKRIPDWASPWVKENGGLWVEAELDSHGAAGQIRHLLSKRRVTQFSFSYDVQDEVQNAYGENELRKLWLHEVGPTPLGMNPLTTLVTAKCAMADPPPPPDEPEPDTRPRLDKTGPFLCTALPLLAQLERAAKATD